MNPVFDISSYIQEIVKSTNYRAPTMLVLQPHDTRESDHDNILNVINEIKSKGSPNLEWRILHECIYEREKNFHAIILVKRWGWVNDKETLDIIKKRAMLGQHTIVISCLTDKTEKEDLEVPIATRMLFGVIAMQPTDSNHCFKFLTYQG